MAVVAEVREPQLGGARTPLWRRTVTHVLLIVGLILMIYPLLWLASSSVRPASEIFTASGLWPSTIRFENFVDGWYAFSDVTFGTLFANSFLIAFGAIVGNLLSCSLAAYAFARLEFRFKNALFFIMLSTMMLPYHVQIIPQYIAFLNIGWVDTLFPLIVPKFLATDAFFIFLMVQFIRGLPRELDESAEIDGAGFFSIYWRVILPLLMPALATTATFTFIFTWNDFFSPLIYLTSSENFTVPLGLRAFLDSEGESSYGPMFAMSLLSLGPIFGFFLASQRFLVHGIATTGLK
ncbi:carbohydrate ABC transporter permease [Tenggerimyces flavus]|uniref:Carbohydrate ABC transporter permease n=1 Tax=Tenggerimyces flavus TaxID=1708749 RepID=A0ABV7YB53_9ACTN|nr:carbohydrate ABC transporter permease [Tenggerimyces flavus]MBM7783819.1 multiple sugar transport system permease protein [Tenggerimyces flavus]